MLPAILAGVARFGVSVGRLGASAARVGGAAARAGGAAAKTGAQAGIESGSRAAMTQMTYGALSHVAQRQPPQDPDQSYDRFPGY